MKRAVVSSFVSKLFCPLFVILLLLCAWSSNAVELTRGPYLQTGTHSSVIIRWRTDEPTESIVLYGDNAENLHEIVGDLEPATEHIVQLSGLDAARKYFYSVGNLDETLEGGADCFFVTHPVPGQPKPTRIWVIGDCGTFNTGAGDQIGVRDAYYEYAGSRHTDLWLALGDNAYYTGTDAEYQANFFDVYPTLLRKSVLWSTIGNHETYSAEGGRFPYLDIFSFPQRGEAGGVASGTENYYSFDYANIHFVCLDSEQSDRGPNGPMLQWLRADLEENTKDWLIAFWHSPPYSKGSHDSDNLFDNFGNMADMRVNAVQLLESYGVDLVLSGHSHIYERSYLLNGHYGFSTTLQPTMIKDSGSGRPDDTGAYLKPSAGPGANQGAVYIVAGSSGWATSRTGYHPVMFFDELETGSLVLDVNGSRLDVKFLRETGAVDDYFTIMKGAAPEALRICTFAIQNGETIVRWKSIAGESYRIERTANLENPVWVTVGGPITATGATTSWSNPVPAGESKSFYRVVQLPREPVKAPMLKRSNIGSNAPRAIRTLRRAEMGPKRKLAK